MQGFLDPPRQNFTAQNILDVIGWAPSVGVDAGYELLDSNDNPVADLSGYMSKSGSRVRRDCNAAIHGNLDLVTEYPHRWGVDRVRPYYLMSCPSVPLGPVRFDLGVFIVTTPGQALGVATPQYTVTGYDKLYLLERPMGDAYSIDAGTGYLAAVTAAIIAAGGGSHITLDGTKAAATLPRALSWSLQDAASTTWLTVINSLLAAIGYRPLWCDQNGYYRSEPYVDPASRTAELVLGGGDSATARYLDPNWDFHTIVSPQGRSINRESFNAPNYWRFVQSGLSFQPTEGSGQYTVQNLAAGPTSQQTAGRVIKAPVQFLTASGQADLAAQGDLIVAKALSEAEALTFKTGPVPLAGHFDILIYGDDSLPGADQRKVVAQTYDLPFDGSDMTWTALVAQAVDGGLWVTGDAPIRPASYDPPPQGGVTYRPPTPPPVRG